MKSPPLNNEIFDKISAVENETFNETINKISAMKNERLNEMPTVEE